ncbi:MAG: PilN domain-containing protein [Candidatus Omnitrophota bacterium]
MIRKSPTTVLEFNATTIRICRCATRKRKKILTHCFAFPIGSDDKETQSLIIAEMRRNALKPENVILSIPRYVAMSRLMDFPARQDQEISQIVGIYAARESAHSCAGVCVYDYQHVGFNKQGHALVQIFLIKQERLSSYVRILAGAGIIPDRVTLNTQGLSNWSSSLVCDDKTERVFRCVSVLNIDDHVFDFNTFLDGRTVCSRAILSSETGLPALVKEVKVSLESCRRMFDFYPASDVRLYVTGKLGRFDMEAFASLLPYPVERFNPIEDLNARPSIKAVLEDDDVSYASVVGLALDTSADGIDITPDELTMQKERFYRWKIYRQSVVFLTVALLLASLLFLRLLQLKEEMISSKRSVIQQLLFFQKSPRELKKNSIVRHALSVNENAVGAFGELYHLTPEAIHLTELVIDEGQLKSMTGWSGDSAWIWDYLKVLRASPLFCSASLEYVHQGDIGSEKRADFKISFGGGKR